MNNTSTAPPLHPSLPPPTPLRHLRRRHPPTQRCRETLCPPRPLRTGARRTAGGAGTGGAGDTETSEIKTEEHRNKGLFAIDN